MDVTMEQWIDIGLQAAGFLAGGAFWAILTWRSAPRVVAAPQQQSKADHAAAQPATAATKRSTVLPRAAEPAWVDLSQVHNAEQPPARSLRDRRLETLALAKDLLARGSSDDSIRERLQISDGELALLRLQQPVGANRRAS